MKIVVLLRHDADDFKGEMIAAHNRTKELLRNNPNAEVRILVLREYFNALFCKMRGVKKIKKADSFSYEGITYKALWFNFSPIDNILVKFNKRPVVIFRKLNKFVKELRDSDIVIAHSTYAGYVALQAKKKYGIPYTVTWHGSDIHTTPVSNPFLRDLTTDILNNADCNCFVSMDLLKKSDALSSSLNKVVLYNGVDRDKFKPYSESERTQLRQLLGIDGDCVNIAFIGNFYHVKNILSLPKVYRKVVDLHKKKNLKFHFIGDGPLRTELERLCQASFIDYKIWGNQPADRMPEYINCMNLIVLPSLNEGLPLISVESLACGVPMVGSRVGGIAESIGTENTVELGENFSEDFAKLIVEQLDNCKPVTVGEDFSWTRTGEKEKQIINNILRQ